MLSYNLLLPLIAYLSLTEASPIHERAVSTTSAASSKATSRSSKDYQTYDYGLGSIYAPAVTRSGFIWYSSNQYYWFLNDALDASCYYQMDKCQLQANKQGNKPFAVSDCNGWQIQACLSGSETSGEPATTSQVAVKTSTSSSATPSAASSATSSSTSSTISSAASSSSASIKTSASSSVSSTASSSTSSLVSTAISLTISSATSSGVASSTSSAASSSASSSAPSPTNPPTTVAAGNWQTYTGAAGGITAPAVTQDGSKWVQSGSTYDDIFAALQQSCYAQASSCSSSSASFDRGVCWGSQVNDCTTKAQSIASSYQSSAVAHSSSVASANFAAATMARTVSGDQQTFKGALGGIPAPAVTGYQYNWKVEGRSDNFYNLIDALSASCYMQQDQAGAVGGASNWAYEMNWYNIYTVQINNCLTNAQNTAANWSASSSAAPNPINTASASSSSSSASFSIASSTTSSTSSTSTSEATSSTSTISSSSSALLPVLPTITLPSVTVIPSISASPSATVISAPKGWSAALTPCIAEGSRGRALNGPSLASSDMTWQKCADFCGGKGYSIFGIEYSQECYCGAMLAGGASLTLPSNNCNMKCGGNDAICGGSNALTLFVKDASLLEGLLSSDLTSVKVSLPTGWEAASSTCVQEGSSGRALAGASMYDDNMTIGKCLAFCKTQGMQYAGIEYSRECYCGNELVNGASLDRTGSCDMTCPGQLGTTCGGPSLLSLYKDSSLQYSLTQIGSWAKQGCIQEVAGRALNGPSLVSNDMTLEKCTSFCANKGFAFAGLEYASECYCGNALANGATLDAFSTQCNMPCSGNAGEICGGPNGISLYSTLSVTQLVGA